MQKFDMKKPTASQSSKASSTSETLSRSSTSESLDRTTSRTPERRSSINNEALASRRRVSLSNTPAITPGIQPRGGRAPKANQVYKLPKISREAVLTGMVPEGDTRWFQAAGWRWADSGFNVMRRSTTGQKCCLEYKGYHNAEWECTWVGLKRQVVYEHWPQTNHMCRFHVVEWMNKVENFPQLLKDLGFAQSPIIPSSAREPTMLEQGFTMQNFATLPTISVDHLRSVSPGSRQWYRLSGPCFNAIRRLVGAGGCVNGHHAPEEWECVLFRENHQDGPRVIPTKLQRWITAHHCGDCVSRQVEEYQAKEARLSTENPYRTG